MYKSRNFPPEKLKNLRSFYVDKVHIGIISSLAIFIYLYRYKQQFEVILILLAIFHDIFQFFECKNIFRQLRMSF